LIAVPEFGRCTTALNGKLAEEMAQIVEATLGGYAVNRQICGDEQMARVADT
jgi:hypothetical protein